MKKTIFPLFLWLCLAFPSSSFAWTDAVHLLLLEDAVRFSPKRVADLLLSERDNWPLAVAAVRSRPIPEARDAFDQAVGALADKEAEPEEKVFALIELSGVVLEASRPADSPLLSSTIDGATGSFQAEWDGYDGIENMAVRLDATRRALSPAKRTFRAYLASRARSQAAAEALATCYHVAVNDLVDAFGAAWKKATGDTATRASKGDRVRHEGAKPPMDLPAGYDPIPTLGAWYRSIRSDYARERIERGGGRPPVPTGLYVLDLPGLKILSGKGAKERENWLLDHPEKPLSPPRRPPPAELEKDRPEVPSPDAVRPKDKGAGRESVRLDGASRDLARLGPLSGREKASRKVAGPYDGTDSSAAPPRSLGEKDVSGAVRGALPRIRSAYNRVLLSGEVSGRITVAFTVLADGSVSSVEFPEDQIGSEEFRGVLTKIFGRLQFPPSSGRPVRVRYPLVFQSGE